MVWDANATPCPLYPKEREPVPILQEAGVPQGRSGRLRKISSLPGFDPLTVHLVEGRYTGCATPVH
jgi:hypothetical protein